MFAPSTHVLTTSSSTADVHSNDVSSHGSYRKSSGHQSTVTCVRHCLIWNVSNTNDRNILLTPQQAYTSRRHWFDQTLTLCSSVCSVLHIFAIWAKYGTGRITYASIIMSEQKAIIGCEQAAARPGLQHSSESRSVTAGTRPINYSSTPSATSEWIVAHRLARVQPATFSHFSFINNN